MFGMRDRLEELEKRVELLEFKEKGEEAQFDYKWVDSGTAQVTVSYLSHCKTHLIKGSFTASMYDDISIKDGYILVRQCHYEADKKVKGKIIQVYLMTELGLGKIDLSLFRQAYPNEV